jgi:hypothetical protein
VANGVNKKIREPEEFDLTNSGAVSAQLPEQLSRKMP